MDDPLYTRLKPPDFVDLIFEKPELFPIADRLPAFFEDLAVCAKNDKEKLRSPPSIYSP